MFLWDAVVGSEAAPLPGSQTSIALESRERYDSHDLSSRIIQLLPFRICFLFVSKFTELEKISTNCNKCSMNFDFFSL